MNKEIKKLTPLEHWKNFLLLVEAPAKARLLDCEWKDGLEQYDYFEAGIEAALKEFEQIKSFCESYDIEFNMVNIREALFTLAQLKGEYGTNWGNYNKKLKALEILKKKNVNVGMFINCCMNVDYQFYLDHHKVIMNGMSSEEFTKEEFNSLKEVFKNE